MYIQPPGFGKSELDGHFGAMGCAVRALVAGDGGRDASNVFSLLMTLHVANTKTKSKNCHARFIQIGRNFEKKVKNNSIVSVTSYPRREMMYDDQGRCTDILLYRSSEEGCIPRCLSLYDDEGKVTLEFEKGSLTSSLGPCSLKKIVEGQGAGGETHVMVLGDVAEEVRLGVAVAVNWTEKGFR